MTRTIAFNADGTMPLWLEQGKRLLAAEKRSGAETLGAAVAALTLDARTAKRFTRVTEFLESQFSEILETKGKIRAGSAVLLEFMKLHELYPAEAAQVADKCFAGHFTVDEMRVLLTKVRQSDETQESARNESGSFRYADFTRLALDRLKSEPALLQKLEVNRLEMAETRLTLMPKVIAHCARKRIAVEIRAPQDDTTRSTANIASALVSRIAVLRLRFDDVVLVMPTSAEKVARETMKLLHEWTQDARESVRTVDVLMLDEKSQQWLTPETDNK
jgi:hypothetical protein